jgi:hypothetical protein
VDQVETAELRRGGGDQAGDVRLLRNVAPNRDCRSAIGIDAGGKLPCRRFIYVTDYNGGAIRGEAKGGRGADAGGPTRDNGNLARQANHPSTPAHFVKFIMPGNLQKRPLLLRTCHCFVVLASGAFAVRDRKK